LETAGAVLELLNILPDIPLVTRDQVPYAKPDPDLFLWRRPPGVDINASVVVGDSVWDLWLLAARGYWAWVSSPEAMDRMNSSEQRPTACTRILRTS